MKKCSLLFFAALLSACMTSFLTKEKYSNGNAGLTLNHDENTFSLKFVFGALGNTYTGSFERISKNKIRLFSNYGPYPRSSFQWSDDSLGVPGFFILNTSLKNNQDGDSLANYHIELQELDGYGNICTRVNITPKKRMLRFKQNLNYRLGIFINDEKYLALSLPLFYEIDSLLLKRKMPQKLTIHLDTDDLFEYFPSR